MNKAIRDVFVSFLISATAYYDKLSATGKEGILSVSIAAGGYYIVAPTLQYLWQLLA